MKDKERIICQILLGLKKLRCNIQHHPTGFELQKSNNQLSTQAVLLRLLREAGFQRDARKVKCSQMCLDRKDHKWSVQVCLCFYVRESRKTRGCIIMIVDWIIDWYFLTVRGWPWWLFGVANWHLRRWIEAFREREGVCTDKPMSVMLLC